MLLVNFLISRIIIESLRLLAKLDMREEFLGKIKRETAAYSNVREDFEINFDNKITAHI